MDKEKRSAILEKVLLLAEQDAEFKDELRKKLEITSTASSVNMDDERLSQIYEYCIEKILRKQAENFYMPSSDFTEKSLLVDDYINMEHERHRDRFDYFSLCLYEQIERIINEIFSVNDFKNLINISDNKLWDEFGCTINKKNLTIGNVIWGEDDGKDKYLSGGKKRAESENLSKLTARDKIRIVILFFKYIVNSVPIYKSGYDELCDRYMRIYLCRNTIHRGNNLTKKEEKVLQEINLNTSAYYFEFIWLLTEFIELTKYYKNIINRLIIKLTIIKDAEVTSLLPAAAFIKIDGEKQAVKVPDVLFSKIKDLNIKIKDSIKVVILGGNIVDLNFPSI